MSIVFFLKNDPTFNGTPRIKEYYQFINADINENKTGHVNEGTIANYPSEYAAFKQYLDKHDTELYQEARDKGEVRFNYEENTI